MSVHIKQLHPHFVGEVSGVDLRKPLTRQETTQVVRSEGNTIASNAATRAVEEAARRNKKFSLIGLNIGPTYGKGKTSSGEVKVTKDLDISLEGADVLIVEDIVDSGVTLNYLMHLLDQRRPHSIRIAALMDKPERRLRPVHVSYVLGQDLQRLLARDGAAVAGDDGLGALDQRPEPAQGLGVRVARVFDHRDLDRRQVVAAHEHLGPRDEHRQAVTGVAGGGVELELGGVAEFELARHGQVLETAQRQWRALRDVVVIVEGSQRSLGLAGLLAQPGRG